MNVELIDKMGSDLSVVNAARVSFAKTKDILDEKLTQVFEQSFEKWLNKNIPNYLEKYFSSKEK